MSDRKRQKSDGTQVRTRILEAALKVFAEEGYDRVSMRKVAAQIGYSATTIYRYFRDKEDLLGAIAAGTYADLSARFERARASTAGRPLASLKALVREYVVFCVERDDMFRLYWDLASFETDGIAVYERLGGTRYRVFQSWFEAIGESLQSRAPEDSDRLRVFLYLLDAANGYIHNRIRLAGIPRPPLAGDAGHYLDRIFRGLEPGTDGKERAT